MTNQGVVARSTGPTSTESVSYATPVGGHFYIDLNSATAAVGTYTLVVQVVRDRAPVTTLVLGRGSGPHEQHDRVRGADSVRQPLRAGPDGIQQ